jgi:hypothetical protein
MSLNKNWGRWCFAAASKHFEDQRQGLPFIIEGGDYAKVPEKDRIEFRMDGPEAVELSRNWWRLDFEINIAISCTKDEANIHRIHEVAGIVAAAFVDIPVYKYGDGDDDDRTVFLGCLTLRQEFDQKVNVVHLGQVEESTRVMQATVEGHYRIQLLET